MVLMLTVGAMVTSVFTSPRSRPVVPRDVIVEDEQAPLATASGSSLQALRACNTELDLDNLCLGRADAVAWAAGVPALGP
jgi:hypothetical protein